MFNDLSKAIEASLVCTVVQTKLYCLRKKFKQTKLVSSGDLPQNVNTQKNTQKCKNKNLQYLKALIYWSNINHKRLKIHSYGVSPKGAYYNDFIHEQSIIQYLYVPVMYPGLLFSPPYRYKSVQRCGATRVSALTYFCENLTSSQSLK